MIIFADTSAIGGTYLGDEADGGWISKIIFNGPDPVVVNELANVEFASLLVRAKSDGRLDSTDMEDCLISYRQHTANDGPIGVVPITGETFVRAQQFVLQVSVRSLDAIHLASAQLLAETSNENVVILTLDLRQAVAAEALGLTLLKIPKSNYP